METFKGKGKLFLVSVTIFLAGLLTGYFIFLNDPGFVISNIEKLMGNILRIGEAMKNRSKLHVTGLIFQNNIRALLVIMFGGIAFGLVSAFSIFFNGLIMGIVMALTFYQGKTISFFLAGILPHGLLELPVVLGAGAFGLKTGLDLLFPKGKRRLDLLKDNLNNNVLALGVFVPLLFIAAGIEAVITPFIINLLVGERGIFYNL
ncbi:MAG: stage II sporulation protein M [Tepidanaerobacteraceae bacterium]|nr:stage II sporulation protein M [Tepidanaerobacter sp.]HQA60068.1 stage II sporulation protein M [Tepidanaerobacteraceae bacterium]HQE05429.1 stage II sporulation protein M [Tepidanaerobacteraceae bacterium]